jgi:hypothetical protein
MCYEEISPPLLAFFLLRLITGTCVILTSTREKALRVVYDLYDHLPSI